MSATFIGLAVLAVIAYAIRSAYKAEQREIQRAERQLRRLNKPPKREDTDVWRQAYNLSKTTRTFEAWQAWMMERGYAPERIIEQAEIQNENVK